MITKLDPLMDKKIELIPINCNKILLIVHGFEVRQNCYTLRLSIHEIRAYRVGPILWTKFQGYGSNAFQMQPMKSTTNTLGITFGLNSESHMELFDVSTDTTKDGPLFVKSGQLNYGRQLSRHPGLP